MPASWKCPQCGLVSFASAAACKRCGRANTAGVNGQSSQPAFAEPAFTQPTFTQPTFIEPAFPQGPYSQPAYTQPMVAQPGIVLEDGYVMPPPPGAGGVWRDGKVLVMNKHAYLPDRCVKCNAEANGLRLTRKLRWHNPLVYLLLLVQVLAYLIVAMCLSKNATIDFGICREHLQRRRILMGIGLGLLALGFLLPTLGIIYELAEVGLLGVLVFLVALVWLVLMQRFVNVKQIDDHFVWLAGIDPAYLAQFPMLPNGPQMWMAAPRTGSL